MSDSKADLVSLLREDHWVFEKIKPIFVDALRKKLFQQLSHRNGEKLHLFGLTALSYGLITKKEFEQGNIHFCKTSTFHRLTPFPQTPLFEKFSLLLPKGAILFIPSEEELRILEDAESLMKEKVSLCWKEYDAHIERLYYFKNVEGHAASHPHLFGVIFVGEDRFQCSPEKIIISLVHELAHQELFLLNTIDRLVLSAADYHLVHAPFQGRARPPIGRLHACHALYRMLQCEQEMDIEDKEDQRLFREAIASLSLDELTPFGGALLQRVYQPYSERF